MSEFPDELKDQPEKIFRVLADCAPVMIWISGTDKLCFHFNRTWLDFTGRALDQEYGNGWTEGVHGDDLPQCMEVYVSDFDRRPPLAMPYRLRRHDGVYRRVVVKGTPPWPPTGHNAHPPCGDDRGKFVGYRPPRVVR